MTAALCTVPVQAQQQAQPSRATYLFDLPAQPMADTLRAIARQAGVNVLFESKDINGIIAPPLRAQLTPNEAIERVLAGSGLFAQQTSSTTLVIRPVTTRETSERVQQTGGERGESGPATVSAAPMLDRDAMAQSSQGDVQELGKFTVTGTRIRGGTTPSPVVTIDSARIREEGYADLGDVIRDVPQNYSGGQNPGVLMGNVIGGGGANQNVTGGSSLNLRGLGPDASLTLLNGRRMAYGGFSQAIDISAIPIEAVERIEIVADGASAIYGSDAVGGVANVILRRDYDGFALGARYGTATAGGMTTREYSATAGTTWSGGGVIAIYRNTEVDAVDAKDRDYTDHLLEPQMLLPASELRSSLVSAHQAIGDTIELRIDALRTTREQRFDYWYANTAAYNALTPRTTTSFVAPGLDWRLPNDWVLSISAVRGKDEWQEDHKRIDPVSGTVVPQVSGCYCNGNSIYEVGLEGPLFDTAAGEVRAALGLGRRENTLRVPAYMTGGVEMGDSSGASRFAYAEAQVPLVGPAMDVAGVDRLELTAALRSERYDSFGGVTTPKLGLIYGPGVDMTIKASWGRSFKAPTLFQINRLQGVLLIPPGSLGGSAYPPGSTVLYAFGGNPGLDPERARVMNASLAIHPVALPGLDLELTWFDIDYIDRVVEPIWSFGQALSNPAFAEFVRPNPTAEQQAALIDGIEQFLNATGAPYDPANVVAFVESRYVNAVRQRIRGFDLTGAYTFTAGRGEWTLRGSASWLDSVQQSAAQTFDLAGTLHQPAKLSGRAGAVWRSGGFSAALFANHKGGVTNVVADEELSSFTTFDLALRHALGARGDVWSGLEFGLSIDNLFDRPPSLYTVPLANQPYVPAYDSTNYSPIGRFVSVSATKRW